MGNGEPETKNQELNFAEQRFGGNHSVKKAISLHLAVQIANVDKHGAN